MSYNVSVYKQVLYTYIYTDAYVSICGCKKYACIYTYIYICVYTYRYIRIQIYVYTWKHIPVLQKFWIQNMCNVEYAICKMSYVICNIQHTVLNIKQNHKPCFTN